MAFEQVPYSDEGGMGYNWVDQGSGATTSFDRETGNWSGGSPYSARTPTASFTYGSGGSWTDPTQSNPWFTYTNEEGKKKYIVPQTENWLQRLDPTTGAPGIQDWFWGDRNQGYAAVPQGAGEFVSLSGMPGHPSIGGQWPSGMAYDQMPGVRSFTTPKSGWLGSDLQGLMIPAAFAMAAFGPMAAAGGAEELAGAAMDPFAYSMPAAVPESAASLSGMGLSQTAPGVWEAAGAGAAGGTAAGSMMPAAVPETPGQLAEWGMKEVAPGQWEVPAGSTAGQGAPVESRTPTSNPNFDPSLSNPDNLKTRLLGLTRMPNVLAQAAQTATGIPFSAINTGKSIFDIASGLYGMNREKKLREMAMRAYDPARELMLDPNMITGLPGYQFGMDQGRQAIQRRMAAQGGGGNEDIALARFTPEYAQRFYEQEFARRMAMAQGRGGMELQSRVAGNNLASAALGSIGYGLGRLGGRDQQNDMLQQILLKMFG